MKKKKEGMDEEEAGRRQRGRAFREGKKMGCKKGRLKRGKVER